MPGNSQATYLQSNFDKALSLHQAGQLAQARQLYLEVLEHTPAHAGALHFLGLIAHQQGSNAEAEEYIRRAICIDDGADIYHYNLGIVLFALQRFEEAIAAYDNALAINSTFANAHSNRGNALKELGNMEDAVAAFSAAIRLRPDFAEAHSNLGFALRALDRIDEAIAACNTAIKLRPSYAKAYCNLGNALRDQDQLDKAATAYQMATRLEPSFAEAHGNLGSIMLDMGQMDKAVEAFNTCLQLKPNNAEVHRNLARLKTYTRDDPHFAMLQQLRNAPIRESEKIHACFAYAKACEDLGELDEAFAAYLEGNRVCKKELAYSFDTDRQLFETIKACFATLPPASSVSAPASPSPILIVGMPRSGSSLAEQILASHSLVFPGGELKTLNTHINAHFDNLPSLGLAETSRLITADYLHALRALNQTHAHITDKMPLNFRWIGFLLLARPDIRIIHTVRDRMAICWSIFKLYFPAKGLGFAFDLHDIAQFYQLYEDLMKFWHERFPGRIYDLNYERLTENQEEETRKLLAYCALDWEDACLRFEQTERPVKTASAMQVRKKIYQGSSESWRAFEKYLVALRCD